MTWKKIVVGYERDHASAQALERAAELAQAENADLLVASIARPFSPAVTAHGMGPFDPVDSPEARKEDLEHARLLLSNADVRVEYEVGVGDPADAIVALADQHEADLIVVGSHERSFLDRVLHGSVSDAVTRHAHCDVLIVH